MTPWSTPIAALLCAALTAPATAATPSPPNGAWSEDGSAEGDALRRRVEAHDDAARDERLGTRGLVFVGDPGSDAGGPAPAQADSGVAPAESGPTDGRAVDVDDLTRQAELERIVRKGRRFFIPGLVIALLGTVCTVGGIAGVAKQATPASGGFLGASIALSLIGWPISIAGIRRRRHPERFLDRTLAVTPGGVAMRF